MAAERDDISLSDHDLEDLEADPPSAPADHAPLPPAAQAADAASPAPASPAPAPAVAAGAGHQAGRQPARRSGYRRDHPAVPPATAATAAPAAYKSSARDIKTWAQTVVAETMGAGEVQTENRHRPLHASAKPAGLPAPEAGSSSSSSSSTERKDRSRSHNREGSQRHSGPANMPGFRYSDLPPKRPMRERRLSPPPLRTVPPADSPPAAKRADRHQRYRHQDEADLRPAPPLRRSASPPRPPAVQQRPGPDRAAATQRFPPHPGLPVDHPTRPMPPAARFGHNQDGPPQFFADGRGSGPRHGPPHPDMHRRPPHWQPDMPPPGNRPPALEPRPGRAHPPHPGHNEAAPMPRLDRLPPPHADRLPPHLDRLPPDPPFNRRADEFPGDRPRPPPPMDAFHRPQPDYEQRVEPRSTRREPPPGPARHAIRPFADDNRPPLSVPPSLEIPPPAVDHRQFLHSETRRPIADRRKPSRSRSPSSARSEGHARGSYPAAGSHHRLERPVEPAAQGMAPPPARGMMPQSHARRSPPRQFASHPYQRAAEQDLQPFLHEEFDGRPLQHDRLPPQHYAHRHPAVPPAPYGSAGPGWDRSEHVHEARPHDPFARLGDAPPSFHDVGPPRKSPRPARAEQASHQRQAALPGRSAGAVATDARQGDLAIERYAPRQDLQPDVSQQHAPRFAHSPAALGREPPSSKRDLAPPIPSAPSRGPSHVSPATAAGGKELPGLDAAGPRLPNARSAPLRAGERPQDVQDTVKHAQPAFNGSPPVFDRKPPTAGPEQAASPTTKARKPLSSRMGPGPFSDVHSPAADAGANGHKPLPPRGGKAMVVGAAPQANSEARRAQNLPKDGPAASKRHGAAEPAIQTPATPHIDPRQSTVVPTDATGKSAQAQRGSPGHQSQAQSKKTAQAPSANGTPANTTSLQAAPGATATEKAKGHHTEVKADAAQNLAANASPGQAARPVVGNGKRANASPSLSQPKKPVAQRVGGQQTDDDVALTAADAEELQEVVSLVRRPSLGRGCSKALLSRLSTSGTEQQTSPSVASPTAPQPLTGTVISPNAAVATTTPTQVARIQRSGHSQVVESKPGVSAAAVVDERARSLKRPLSQRIGDQVPFQHPDVQSLTATTAAAPLTAGSGTQGLVDDTDVLQPSHFEPQHVSAVDMFGQGSQPARHFIVGATQQDVQLSQEFTVFSVPGELLSDLKDAFQNCCDVYLIFCSVEADAPTLYGCAKMCSPPAEHKVRWSRGVQSNCFHVQWTCKMPVRLQNDWSLPTPYGKLICQAWYPVEGKVGTWLVTHLAKGQATASHGLAAANGLHQQSKRPLLGIAPC